MIRRSSILLGTVTAAVALVGCTSARGPSESGGAGAGRSGQGATGGALASGGHGNEAGRVSGAGGGAPMGGSSGAVSAGSGGTNAGGSAGNPAAAGMANDGGRFGSGGGAGNSGGGRGGSAGAGGSSGAAAGAGGSAGVGGSAGASAGASGTGQAGSAGGGSVTCPASVTIKAGDNNETIMVGGLSRTYLVHAPPGYTGKTPVPVLFDFHGLSGTGSQQKSLSRWDKLGDSEGFITVFPDGVDNAWNAGLCCANDTSIDDVAFVRAMIGALETDACIDPKRVYASGCSNGGGMSFKLACEAADVIAAVAPVDFDCVDGSGCGTCKPSRPITEVQFRGTSDQLVAYDGSGAFLGAEKNFMLWGGLNMCTGSPAALSSNSACQTYPMCGADTETVLCTVQNGMHCGNYSSFMITQVAWGVLKDQSLP
jgi:polyhydroxybutyrate depolymerase